MSYNEFLSSFSTSLGVEKARQIVDDAISKAGFEKKDQYQREESLRICECLGENDLPSVRIISHAIKGRCKLRN